MKLNPGRCWNSNDPHTPSDLRRPKGKAYVHWICYHSGMSINPYRPPEVELTQSKKRNETNRTRRYRGLVTLSRVCLLAYNVYFFCFIVCFSIGLPLQLLGGQRGLLVPEYVEVCVFLVMVPLAVMSVLGNWYVFGLCSGSWLRNEANRDGYVGCSSSFSSSFRCGEFGGFGFSSGATIQSNDVRQLANIEFHFGWE